MSMVTFMVPMRFWPLNAGRRSLKIVVLLICAPDWIFCPAVRQEECTDSCCVSIGHTSNQTRFIRAEHSHPEWQEFALAYADWISRARIIIDLHLGIAKHAYCSPDRKHAPSTRRTPTYPAAHIASLFHASLPLRLPLVRQPTSDGTASPLCTQPPTHLA